MKIIPIDQEEEALALASSTLLSGGLVVFPTETCYGIGVDATNAEAVEKLLMYKGNRGGKAISVAVADEEMAMEYVEANEMARHIYRQFLPGPVTVISKSKGKVAEALVSDRQTLGIRIPDQDLIRRLIARTGRPITATSANTSGKKPPYSFRDLEKYTSKKRLEMIDIFLDAGTLPPRPPSSVVDTTLEEPEMLRAGTITLPELKKQTQITQNEAETRALGQKLMNELEEYLPEKAVVFAMQGDLGAGKTQLTKGIATALKIEETVASPTYTIMHEYDYSLPDSTGTLFHVDTWRLANADDLETLELAEKLKPGNVLAVEWVEKTGGYFSRLSPAPILVYVTVEGLDEQRRKISWLVENK